MLDIEAIEDEDCFVPHLVVSSFADTVAHLSGEEHFGLIVAPHLTIASKGCWGEYMLEAPTLGEAIERGTATIGFHSKGDIMSLAVSDGRARLSYASAAKGQEGYAHVALGSVGILLSLCKGFLPASWRPMWIELDIPRPRKPTVFEDVFDCPVVFDTMSLSVCFEAHRLESRSLWNGTYPPLTVGDVARARVDWGRIDGLRGVIAQQVWAQVLSGTVSIEGAARSLGTSVRTLQRELNREGTSFREFSNLLRAKRAMELLQDTRMSVTEISAALGYSSPAHFARAFRKAVGVSPHEFQRHHPLMVAA
jgi:AraC-like DNA-binding protein